MQNSKPVRRVNARKLTVTAMLAALASVLMMFQFSVPLVPSFLQMDFSELPAILAAFTINPAAGVAVCLIKNLIHLAMTTTGGVGELSNFILGVLYVLPAGLLYKRFPTIKGAIAGSLAGSAVMAVGSVVTNYFLIYPVYAKLMPMDAIIGMYQAILPSTDGLMSALLVFNMPFTLVKGLMCAFVAVLVYKPLSKAVKS